MGRPVTDFSSAVRLTESVAQETRSFEDQTITGPVLLDGASFQRCRFRHAVLVYTGGEPPRIQECAFEDVAFQFQGAAGRSLALLQAMASPSSGLKEVFKASFPRLFGH